MLLPQPKRMTRTDGWRPVSIDQGGFSRSLDDLQRMSAEGLTLQLGPRALSDRRIDHPEAYEIGISPDKVKLSAPSQEGMLRAQATLLQLIEQGPDGPRLPYCHILDWPNIRYRCASDWLLNCEINRWGYDWGDGPEAFLGRIKRKLEMCFRYKINQVWFDGFGWDINRFPGYAELMRECTRHARRLGIKLTFAGYGGGYGTSYQTSELYRCGYQGQVFLNRRPWPDGEVYACRGLETSAGRQYGSCLSNQPLAEAKLAEMRQFVQAVEPGFMYIHDIDSGTWEASRLSWLMRCDECRARWPSDELTDPQGMTGALAEWFRYLAQGLQQVGTDGYEAARDLTLSFTSPLYASHDEPDQPAVWDREVEYFRLLSELMGPVPGIEFGIREQFLRPDGQPKVRQLAEALSAVGHGHGVHVIGFGGGDNYYSSDLCNTSGVLAGLYEGAESVCLSNGGVHEEPVQALNAEFLWNAGESELAFHANSQEEVDDILQEVRGGAYRPESVFGKDGLLKAICADLWGPEAGQEMFGAYLCGGDTGNGPVSRVWWTVTREVRRLRGDPVESGDWTWEQVAERWRQRVAHTAEALRHAQAAAAMTDDEDVQWFARCLHIGAQFGEALALLAAHRSDGDPDGRLRARELLAALQHDLTGHPRQFTDILGGDPGCWHETLENLIVLAQE